MKFSKLFREKPGDDTGMQTRVWGPAGWLFLHSIAQNYPWNPTEEQKVEYLFFFKLIGNVLPCRYCRESYQDFIEQPDSQLNITVMKSRLTLVKWLYLVHNKVNKKLNISDSPTLKQVWDKYESFRSKCTKSPEIVEKIKTGCLDPLNGYRKICKISVVDVDSEGNEFGINKNNFGINKNNFGINKNNFGKSKKGGKIRLVSVKKSNLSGKKLMATFEIAGKKRVIHFGAAGMGDYTKHKDLLRRNRYIFRHNKDTSTGNPTRAGYLSLFILWNKSSLKASISDYRRRLLTYNRTGKFPTKIIGYKSPGKKKFQ